MSISPQRLSVLILFSFSGLCFVRILGGVYGPEKLIDNRETKSLAGFWAMGRFDIEVTNSSASNDYQVLS